MLRLPAPLLFVFGVAVTPVLADELDFAHDVVPVLKKHCAECHTGEKSESGFSFNTQRKLLESGYIDVRQPDKSRLLELVESQDPEDQMPPKEKGRLSVREISVLKRWVMAGGIWEPGFRFAASGYEPPLLPRTVELPAAETAGQNPIDRILSVYFAERESAPGESVADHVFLRRAYMDLIGLPPSLAEQEEFAGWPAETRRERLVEQLLSRDRDYAEHWITFWNDLLRNDYVGTGYIDGGRKQITSWLYGSLVDNMPYDQFVRELIAPGAESEGFIKGIKWRGSVNASQVREVQFAQNVSQVFLGINMKCASCHHSFIDRWTLDEAYGLAAIYSTRDLEIHRCDKPTGRIAKARWIFPEIGEVDAAADQPERLIQLATVMTSPKNGRFARTIVNRLWHRLMGHGIVHPVDAMHTKPWNADLLDFLANYLVEQKYDVKAVLRLIATSHVYQSRTAPAQDSATSEEFTFRGPISRHLTAEQFLDSVWALTNSDPGRIQAPISALQYYGEVIPNVELGGRWIWTYADTTGSPAGEQAAFRKTLTFGADMERAWMVITCDNEYTAYVNGKRVGADKNWGTIESLNLTRRLQTGPNEILIIGRNAGNSPNPAGLYAELHVVDSENKKIQIATDESWQASSRIPKPRQTGTVEWNQAHAVIPQNFLPQSATDGLKAELSLIENNSVRRTRAALLKSNLLMRSLGRPNREQVVTTRPDSLSTLQAIDLANGEILDSILSEGAETLPDTIHEPGPFVDQMFRTALCRAATDKELRLATSVIGESPTKESVQDFLWLLVMLPEFQFIQ